MIQAIFNTDPSARATLDEIIRHPFLTDFEIPAVLTVSIKSFAPTKEFLKKYNTCKVGSEMVVRGGRSKSANQIHMDGL